MKVLRLFLIASIVFGLFIFSHENALAEKLEEVKKPRLVVDSFIFDFEEVEVGTDLSHTFKVKNAGDGVLIIQDVKPSRGYFTEVSFDKTIPPGQEGNIHVTISLTWHPGPFVERVTVYSNDSDQPKVELRLEGIADDLFRPDF